MVNLKDAVNYEDINLYYITLGDLIKNDTEEIFEANILYKNRSRMSSDKHPSLTVVSSQFKLLTVVNNSDNSDSMLLEVEFLDDYAKFYDTVCSIDNHITDAVYRNSKKMFGKELSLDTVEDLYKKMVKLPLTLDSNPRMILPVDTSKITEDVVKQLKDGSYIKCVLLFDKVKFYKNKFVTDVKVVNIDVVASNKSNKKKKTSRDEYVKYSTKSLLLSDSESSTSLDYDNDNNNNDVDSNDLDSTSVYSLQSTSYTIETDSDPVSTSVQVKDRESSNRSES